MFCLYNLPDRGGRGCQTFSHFQPGPASLLASLHVCSRGSQNEVPAGPVAPPLRPLGGSSSHQSPFRILCPIFSDSFYHFPTASLQSRHVGHTPTSGPWLGVPLLGTPVSLSCLSHFPLPAGLCSDVTFILRPFLTTLLKIYLFHPGQSGSVG